MKKLLLAALAAGLFASPASARTYKIDPAHSAVSFRVAHMVISRVNGRFDIFEGTVDYEKGNPKSWKTSAVIDASSIDTDNKKRDGHLRSADFFDVEKFPKIVFKSTKVTKVKGKKAKLHGEFTLHGVTKKIVMDVTIAGEITDSRGNRRVGAVATTTIDRRDYGLTWSKTLEAGGLMVGHEIDITLDIEAIAKK